MAFLKFFLHWTIQIKLTLPRLFIIKYIKFSVLNYANVKRHKKLTVFVFSGLGSQHFFN